MKKTVVAWLKASLLPMLIIGQSLAVYLVDNSYPLTAPEVWLAFGAVGMLALAIATLQFCRWPVLYRCSIAGLIAIFLVIKFEQFEAIHKYGLAGLAMVFFYVSLKLKNRVYPVAAVVFAGFLAGSVIDPMLSPRLGSGRLTAMAAVHTVNPRPRIVHLILDEHIGLEGIPIDTASGRAAKEQIKSFYRKYDFVVYGGAYSHYLWTYNAVPNALNLASDGRDAAFITGGLRRPKIAKNTYFKILLDRGYAITAVKTEYLDVCADKAAAPQRCMVYDIGALGAVAKVRSFSTIQKAQLIALGYIEGTRLFRNGIRGTYKSVQDVLASHGIRMPPWPWTTLWDHNVYWTSSVNTMSVMESLWSEILATQPGSVFFAHVMLPHRPYAYSANCSLRPIGQWEGRERGLFFEELHDRADIDRRREVRYEHYYQQLQCLYAELDGLFVRMKAAGIFDDSIIILHGDHGSRILRHEPTPENAALLTDDDYKDAFSTLFAIRAPGRAGAYDSSVRPLEELLAESLQMSPELDLAGSEEESEPFVYLRREGASDGKLMLKVPYAPFGRDAIPHSVEHAER